MFTSGISIRYDQGYKERENDTPRPNRTRSENPYFLFSLLLNEIVTTPINPISSLMELIPREVLRPKQRLSKFLHLKSEDVRGTCRGLAVFLLGDRGVPPTGTSLVESRHKRGQFRCLDRTTEYSLTPVGLVPTNSFLISSPF